MGFRPFVYHLAKRHLQNGWVANSSDGVSIAIEGSASQQQQFLFDLQNQLPAFATIDSLSIQQKPLVDFNEFQIKPSVTEGTHSAFVLPDISPCQDCISELFNPQSRFYRYPFTSCCFCGSRYSIMLQQPYDRIRTSMAEFVPCSECLSEYSSAENRRFHSQTIACPNCGPQLNLLDREGNIIQSHEDALSTAIHFLKQGKIVAIKGVGGFQLMADATNSQAIEDLRLRKQRPEKPFALMTENLASAKELCQINKTEQQALISPASPIVLLKRLNLKKSVGSRFLAQPIDSTALQKNAHLTEWVRLRFFQSTVKPIACTINPRPTDLSRLNATCIANSVAPHNILLGIMLPASPLHHLLAHDFGKPLVVTSGNRMNEPICTTDQQALDRLGNIADFFLTHNRSIVRALDDSIVRNINNKPVFMRRARGYTPLPITISKLLPDTLALGGQMKNTIAINQGKQLILSQHIGDLNSVNSQQQFQQTITGLQGFYLAKPSSVMHDLHPDYHSSIVASQQGINTIAIQHHHAHILSCMAEHDLQAPVLGFAWDGNGLGVDNTSWGGECFVLTGKSFNRFAYLRPFPLVGGDKAASEPRRSALGLLYEMSNNQLFNNKLDFLSAFTQQELNLLQQSLKKQLNCPYTSSIGRLFGAVSSLLGLCHINQFEGQAAMLLEQLASSCFTEESYPFRIEVKKAIIIDWEPLMMALIADLKQLNKNLIAAKFHNTLAEITVQIAIQAKQKQIVLSGGCFQNAYLTERCVKQLESAGFTVYTHEKIPSNDGGLALGQLYAKVITG